MTNFDGQRVLILGAARQGLALARYLAGKGALVTLSDNRAEEQMEAAQASLAGLPGLRWALGGHPLELLDSTDLLALSGGIPLTLPIVVEAQRRAVPLTNDSQIFMEGVPCRVIGITGSAGKTTTTTLVGRMAQAAAESGALSGQVWVGGNIGQPLIGFVDQMTPADLAILELSSFQLEQMTLSPHIAAVLNITPNHLDRHGSMQAYTAAKARILAFQDAGGTAILNRDDPGSWDLRGMLRGSLVSFGLKPPAAGETGTWLADADLCLSEPAGQHVLMPRSVVGLRGDHNLLAVLAACAIAHAAGLPAEAMQAGVEGFGGVPHRLELVRSLHGIAWYNDSIATAPERAMAAIRSFDEPLVLLAGGRDKNLPWEEFARLVHERVDHLIVFGEAAGKILNAVGPAEPGRRPYSLTHCEKFDQAVQAAAEISEPGDVVLLSPGGTSYDEFRDFEERGEWYRKWVKELS